MVDLAVKPKRATRKLALEIQPKATKRCTLYTRADLLNQLNRLAKLILKLKESPASETKDSRRERRAKLRAAEKEHARLYAIFETLKPDTETK